MYQLFSQPYTAANAIIRPPGMELVRRTYEREISKIVNWYNNRVVTVKSNHLLVRLLDIASIPIEYDLDRYIEAAVTRSPYVARHFNFTSAINYGKFFEGDFYGPGNQELILFSDEDFDYRNCINNWQQLTAVKVLLHPISDLGLFLPNGTNGSTDTGLVVIEVNLPMLLVQYRYFLFQQMAKQGTADTSLLSTAHFVAQYVLPNMLSSHTDLVILNRLMNLYYGAPMGAATKRYPFAISNYSDKLDRVLGDILKRIEDHSTSYFSNLKTIPTVFAEDMQAALLMPDIAPTRQVWWALLLSRFRIMTFLIDTGGERGQSANRSYINKLQLDLKRLDSENILETKLPDNLFHEIQYEIDRIRAL